MYFLQDMLSTRLITDSSGVLAGRQDHLPFGEDAGTGSGESEKHRFTSYERDSESGTDYAINRQYATNTGGFTRPDPYSGSTYLTNPQTLNRYTYGWSDPINKFDPLGLDSLLFDVCKLTRFDDNGKSVQSWDAVSGLPGTTGADQGNKGSGPLPEGSYTVDPKDSQYRFDTTIKTIPSTSYPYVQSMAVYSHPLWAHSDDQRSRWGNYRTVLSPDPGTDLHGRDPNGFFAHGGDTPGSKGCIDLTGQNDAFHQFLRNYGKPIKLTVKYTCNPWQKGANQPGGFGGGAFGFGGAPWWMYSLSDFLNWLDSIQVPKKPDPEKDHLA